MRRMIISLTLVAAILTMSVVNIVTLSRTRTELDSALGEILTRLEQTGDTQAVFEDTLAFQELWMQREKKLMRFIRHSDLEQITWDAARLPSLARHGEIGELSAGLSRIRTQVNHLWETQLPRPGRVL